MDLQLSRLYGEIITVLNKTWEVKDIRIDDLNRLNIREGMNPQIIAAVYANELANPNKVAGGEYTDSYPDDILLVIYRSLGRDIEKLTNEQREEMWYTLYRYSASLNKNR